MVAAKVAAATKWRIREESQVRSGLRARIADRDGSPGRIEVRALWLARVGGVGGGENVERKAAGESSDASHLPAFKNPTRPPFGEMLASLADRQIPRVVDHQPLRYVEVGIPPLSFEV